MWTRLADHRRSFLKQSFNGIGALALGDLLSQDLLSHRLLASDLSTNDLSTADPIAPKVPHHRRGATNCIFLFMQGGVSQVDSFDYKPALAELHGKPLPRIPNITGELQGRLSFPHVCIASPFKFQAYGDSKRYISELYPHLAKHVDDMAFVYGVRTDNQNHGPSTLHVTTGSQFPGSPSVGSWVTYGLGTFNQDMPSYVVIQDPRGAPVNGAAVWSNGYLPATFQGTLLRPQGTPILNLDLPPGVTRSQQERELELLGWFNRNHQNTRSQSSELEARIRAYELAFRMQMAAPELVDIQREPEHIHRLYGLDDPHTAGFGRQCLLARRLVESGVRYTLLVHGVQIGPHSWDDHGDVRGGMVRHSREVDQPVAALLTDLKQRGLLQNTLVVWASEMGRTPFKNGGMTEKPGRDHNSHALAMWLAGGDVQGGVTAGRTDEFGLTSMGDSISIRDVHATILDLLGLDDDRLRYLHAGRLRQLTDIGGRVLREITRV